MPRHVLGVSEVAQICTVIQVHLYWEGCVIICGYLWVARYTSRDAYVASFMLTSAFQPYIVISLFYTALVMTNT